MFAESDSRSLTISRRLAVATQAGVGKFVPSWLRSLFRGIRRMPNAVKLLFKVQLVFLSSALLVALVIGTTAVNHGYQHISFAIPAKTPVATWQNEVDLFADRVSKGLGVRQGTAEEFSGWILEAATRQDIPPELMASLVLTESSFRKNVRSHVGAIGPAQVRPRFWSRFCGTKNLQDPAENIYCGAQVLAHLMDRCGGEACALKAYNIGPYGRQEQAGQRYLTKIGTHRTALEAL